MRMLDLAGHLAFALIALSLLVRDIVWLRALSISASIASIAYSYFAPREPLWIVIGWNIAFILVNLIQIGLLVREQRAISFSEEEKELFATSFSRFSPIEFMRLLRIGRWAETGSGTLLIRANEENGQVILLYSGRAAVEKNGRKLTELRSGDFAGEMSFITGQVAAANVTTLEATRYLSWDKETLGRLLERNPSMRLALQAELNADMARKMSRRTGMTGAFAPPSS